mgnify:FL=1
MNDKTEELARDVFDYYGPGGIYEFNTDKLPPLNIEYVVLVCERYLRFSPNKDDIGTYAREDIREIMLYETGRQSGMLVRD